MKRASSTAISSLTLPLNSYIYTIAPINHNAQIAAISSDDSLRIIDSSTLKEVSNGIIPNVHAGVTCFDVTKDGLNYLSTAGRDGLVQYWDLREKCSTLKFQDGEPGLKLLNQDTFPTGTHGSPDSKAAYLSLCCGDSGPVVGTELHQSQASVIQW